ncbi:MAG: M81 family metallopeptidase [Chitinophagaceae bacterium]|nr:M81 family metallopeptidase [Rubrivivax sp.]
MRGAAPLRLFFGGILTETNTFSPIPVGLQNFIEGGLLRGAEVLDPVRGQDMARYAQSLGVEVLGGLYCEAHPGAAVRRDAFEALRDELLDRLRAALPVDIVALNMHGGMVAQGCDDCEGDIIARVRAIVGPEVVIGCELDPHSHLSPAMHRNAILMCYRENPHIDIDARGRELVDLLLRIARREVRPVTSVFDCRMADVFQTQREPMKSFVARMRALEGHDGVLSISIVHGFRRADIPLLGTHVIVITDDQAAHGAVLAERLGRELFALRGQCADPTRPMDEAVAAARDWDASTQGPLVLAELADNPGGGSPGDATYVLKALIDAGIDRIVAGALIDPQGVRTAFDAGVGAQLTMRIGGKACPLSGPPLDLDVTVTALDPASKIVLDGGTTVQMGRAAALRFAQGELLLAENRHQTYGPSIFADLGIELKNCRVILVKSAQHFKAHFSAIAPHSITLDSPGVCVADVTKLPFKRLPRPLWPWDEDPWKT